MRKRYRIFMMKRGYFVPHVKKAILLILRTYWEFISILHIISSMTCAF